MIESDASRTSSARRPAAELVLASLLVLFQELAFIRWLPAEVRVVAYFPNLVLISAFLGLGIGSLRSGKPSLLAWWPVLVAATVAAGLMMGRVAFTAEGISEHLWLLYDDLPEGAPVVDNVRLPIVVLFVLSTASFVPLGQFVAERIQRFKEAGAPLRGYAFDLGGSLVGVVAFGVLSGLGAPPVVWFSVVALLGAAVVFARSPRAGLVAGGVGLLVAASVGTLERSEIYSPYYALTPDPVPGLPDVRIRANGSLHQVAADLVNPVEGSPPRRDRAVEGYHRPYRMLGRPLGKVLVLGAGTGNDVAVLLDEGAAEVHAVEIDPELVALGRRVHPNDPYASDRVRVFVTDARSYLESSTERYDLVVFGTLDSMTRLAALSTVRLDNFVYTAEAVRAARSRMAPDGGLAMYFMVGEEFIHDRLVGLLFQEFGTLPALVQGDFDMFNHVYLAGPAFVHLRTAPEELDAWFAENRLPALEIPTDDWPYLYLERRAVSDFYLSLMGILGLLAFLGVWAARPSLLRRGSSGEGGVDWEMLLFGAAFLLMETRYITAMNLLWGATWITSAVVFGAILVTILVATLWTEGRTVSWPAASGLLVAGLVATYLIPPHTLLATEGLVRLTASVAYVGVPVFFAAVCFALRFQTRRDAGQAFGWNVLGAVLGGLLEFLGMSLGFAALVLVALTGYLVAFLLKERGSTRRFEAAT